MYKNTEWIDHVVDPDTGTVVQEGTPQSAVNFNNEEFGILDGHIALQMMMVAVNQLNGEAYPEIKDISMTNTMKYPFNNSAQTVSLSNTRSNANYQVDTYVTAASGDVGDVIVYDKLTNGFKIRYDGSASSATVRVAIRGGS